MSMKTVCCHNPAAVKGLEGDFDPRKIREDFPILAMTIHEGKPLAYLDNAATTQKPSSVVCALCDYYQLSNANVHRSMHYLAERATRYFEDARKKAARFIGARSDRSIVFTRGTTESINLVAHGWGRKFVKQGDEIVLTEMEHHSNLIPWQMLAQQVGATLKFIPVLPDGTLDLAAYRSLLSPKTRLVALTHMSNVLGTINPVQEIISEAHRVGAYGLLDGAQSVPHLPVDVTELDCDFLAFSGHKMLGPTGVGILYSRESILEAMDPFMGGGEMIGKVYLDHATWADIPQKFEAGTPHISGAIGLGAAMDYLAAIGMEKVHSYETELSNYALLKMRSISGLRIFGEAQNRGGAISFDVEGIHPHDLAQYVDQAGVAIRAGHLCAQPLMRKLGVPAVNRASLYIYNVKEDVDQLVEAINKAKEYFNHGT